MIIAQFVLIQPLDDENKQLNIKIQAISVEMGKLEQQMETTQQLLAVSSKVKLNNQLKTLGAQIQQQKQLLKQLTDNLIAPSEISAMLEKILKQRGKLRLISLKNLQPQGLYENDKDDSAGTKTTPNKKPVENQDQVLVYRHPVELIFKGKYFQVLDYLKALENSGYKFYWDQLDYKVEKYPIAEVSIRLSTLGTEAHWMGANIHAE